MDQDQIKDTGRVISAWQTSSDENYDTMMDLYKSGRYNWSMFLGHLCVEKLLKAYFVKRKNTHCPNLHNLLRIAELAGLELNQEQRDDFAMITTFNIYARYDDYKQSFQKKCTREFTDKWIQKINSYRQWIKELIR
jgi:HEPN domain-containing protein